MCREQEAIDTWVRVERLYDRMSLVGIGGAVEAHVRNRGHVLLEEVGLDDVEHLLHLAKDEHTVLGERPRPRLLRIHQFGLGGVARRTGCEPDAAVEKELPVGTGTVSSEREPRRRK